MALKLLQLIVTQQRGYEDILSCRNYQLDVTTRNKVYGKKMGTGLCAELIRANTGRQRLKHFDLGGEPALKILCQIDSERE
ncbi:hypothetical protein RRG08_036601 [Elysia crispata]|uniref:Uncharacterized protein n=1 Tax=Elysia crispata TaxID=231223 RepID=A0AAE1DKF3_9GAST|nr:hypothetical protein RRG08_036601 [Elysia crispata]